MSTLKNHVQLIGNVGQEPTITNLESGKKVATFFNCYKRVLQRCQRRKANRIPIGILSWLGARLPKSLRNMLIKEKKLP